MQDGAVCLSPLPMFHTAACVIGTLGPLWLGGTEVLVETALRPQVEGADREALLALEGARARRPVGDVARRLGVQVDFGFGELGVGIQALDRAGFLRLGEFALDGFSGPASNAVRIAAAASGRSGAPTRRTTMPRAASAISVSFSPGRSSPERIIRSSSRWTSSPACARSPPRKKGVRSANGTPCARSATKNANEPSRVEAPMSIPFICRTATTQDAAASPSIDIQEFVPLAKVDPIYFETSYFSVPEEAGEAAPLELAYGGDEAFFSFL